jgi:outer membrane protein
MALKSMCVSAAAVTAVICGLLVTAPAVCQSPIPDKPIRMAVIDVEKVVSESRVGQDARAELQKLTEEKSQQGKALQDEVADLRRRIQEGELSLAEDKLEGLRQQLEDRLIAFRRFQDDTARELNTRQEAILQDINRKVIPVIDQVARELEVTLIFNKFQGALLYVDEAYDVTGLVIQRFNESLSESE